MDVSVVIPTRNRSSLLSRTLASVLRQQHVAIEVIVVDEASTDGTAALLRALNDERVRVIRHEKPLGVSSARNRGAAAARGAWLAFVDDDDLWAPDKLAAQLDAAQSTGHVWAYVGSVNITEQGHIVSGGPPPSADEVVAALPTYNAIPGGGSNVVMRRTTWQQAGPFDIRLRNTEDWEMWIRLAKHGPPACVSRPLLAYRVHSSNASLDTAEIVRGAKLIETLHHTTVNWGVLHRWMAESCLRRGQRGAAVREFIEAALHGQLRGALSDMGAIVRRRIPRRPGWMRTNDVPVGDTWTREADRWLTELGGRNLTVMSPTSIERDARCT